RASTASPERAIGAGATPDARLMIATPVWRGSVYTFGACSVGWVSRRVHPRSARSQPRVFDGEELPSIGDALERMTTAISERDARAANKVSDCSRDEDFVGLGHCLYALGDVDGDAADVVAMQFDLADVEPNADLDANSVHCIADSTRAAHRPTGPVK